MVKKFMVEFSDDSWKKVSELIRECMRDTAGIELDDTQVVEDICSHIDCGDYGNIDVLEEGVRVKEVK